MRVTLHDRVDGAAILIHLAEALGDATRAYPRSPIRFESTKKMSRLPRSITARTSRSTSAMGRVIAWRESAPPQERAWRRE